LEKLQRLAGHQAVSAADLDPDLRLRSFTSFSWAYMGQAARFAPTAKGRFVSPSHTWVNQPRQLAEGSHVPPPPDHRTTTTLDAVPPSWPCGGVVCVPPMHAWERRRALVFPGCRHRSPHARMGETPLRRPRGAIASFHPRTHGRNAGEEGTDWIRCFIHARMGETHGHH
jgi:hypothetical protein